MSALCDEHTNSTPTNIKAMDQEIDDIHHALRNNLTMEYHNQLALSMRLDALTYQYAISIGLHIL